MALSLLQRYCNHLVHAPILYLLFFAPWLVLDAEPTIQPSSLQEWFDLLRVTGSFLAAIAAGLWLIKLDTDKIALRGFSFLFSYSLTLLATTLMSKTDFSVALLPSSMVICVVCHCYLKTIFDNSDAERQREHLENLILALFFLVFVLFFTFFIRDVAHSFQQGQIQGYRVYESNSKSFFGIHPPRSSGMARTSLILFGFLIYFQYKKTFSASFILPLLCLTLFSWFYYQSRGQMIMLICALTVFFMNKNEINTVILKRTILTFLSAAALFALYLLFMVFFDDWANLPVQNYPLFRDFLNLELSGGRFEIWSSAVPHLWESPIYGHGAQADRFLLEGKSMSNGMGYALLCAGIFGGVLFLATVLNQIYFAVANLVGLQPRKKKIMYAERFLILFLLVALTVRTIFETGLAVYGLDFLLFSSLILFSWMVRSVEAN